MPRKTPVRFHLDQDLLRWLRAEARRLRCSLSQVVRNLIMKERDKP